MRIALAGLGFMGATHARALRSVTGATLAAIVSSDAAKLSGDLTLVGGNLPNQAAEKLDFSAVRKYTRLNEALADPEIDAVDICLPSDLHFEAAKASLRAGKHVLVEKPLALEAAAAAALIEEARRAERTLMCAHVLRFMEPYVALAAALHAERLGPVRSAFFRRRCAAPVWNPWLTDGARSGGAVMDLLIHDIDFCLRLFGKPDRASAVGFADLARGIDWMEARLHFAAIGPVVVTGGWHHPKTYPFAMEFTVVSDAGTLDLSPGGALMLYRARGTAESVTSGSGDPFVAELQYFADCVRENRWPDLCPPTESAMAVKLGRTLMESRARGGEAMECRL